jgi:hypothetical protein
MKDQYLLDGKKVVRNLAYGDKVQESEADTNTFLSHLSDVIPYDTGWLPPGLRSYTQINNYSQAVLVAPPGVNRVYWGARERDRNVKQYMLAQPWRVIIVDMLDGDLHGVRMFYSPVPINSPEQEMYHQNLPNINCLGYRDNGVGWVCLYKTDSWKGKSLGEKLFNVLERCSGAEAYNDANMREIDGPSMYRAMGMPNYTWNPKEWEKKTAQEGVLWTFDPGVWVPVLVYSRDRQASHKKAGVPLTLEMAMNGSYAAFYNDPRTQKITAKLREKQDLTEDTWDAVRAAFARS